MAARNAFFFVNFHSLSIRLRFGQYDGRNRSVIVSCVAPAITAAHRWDRALSSTTVTAPLT
jgi:hypothetical protein